MQHDHAFHKLQDLLLGELQNKQPLAAQGTVEDFLRFASAKGYYIDDLTQMAESGMSGQQIVDIVASTYP
jgi:hypothetical protein